MKRELAGPGWGCYPALNPIKSLRQGQRVPTPPRLEVRNLIRRFDGRTVVDDVSLAIEPGQVTCLLGPSGCG